MRKLILVALILVAAASTAGELFPLANTRYGAAEGNALLRTNGSDAVVFWRTGTTARATKVVEGQNRAGEVIFEESYDLDVVWTGTRFLAVSTGLLDQTRGGLIGRHLDANGRPLGQPFMVLADAQHARLAAGHGTVMMAYHTGGDTYAVRLKADGRPAAEPVVVSPYGQYAVTATAGGFTVVSGPFGGIRATRLDATGRIVGHQTLPRPVGTLEVAVASQGTRTVAVWTWLDRIEAAVVDAAGNFSAPLLIDSLPSDPPGSMKPSAPSPVWNGNGWTVAYQVGTGTPHLRVAHLDAPAQRVASREESPAGRRNPSLAVLGGKILATWTPYELREPAWIGALPLATDEARPVTFAPANQGLVATAASEEGVLAVWAETIDRRTTLRAGLRTRDGQWREQEIATSVNLYQIVAEGDGRNFVVIVAGSAGTSEAIFLDGSGRPTGLRALLPMTVEAVAWNGSHYALLDRTDDLRLLSPNGTLSAPVDPGVTWDVADVISNGDGFLAIGGRADCPFILCTAPFDTRVLRLDANLQRVGAELVLAPEHHYPNGAVWTGTEYVVVWTNATGIGFSRVSPDAGTEPRSHHVPMTIQPYAVAPVNGGVAVLDIRPNVREVKYFTSGGALYRTETIETSAGRTDLVPFGSDTLAYVTSPLLRDPPHYGTRHVSMGILANADLARPAAPHLTVRDDGVRFIVQWSAPSGAVNGYRVEYRIDDGIWIELERWFGPGETSISIRRPSFGSTFAFRVRALNDAGAGAYSTVGTPVGRKRRAAK